jgi:hypothetical protein
MNMTSRILTASLLCAGLFGLVADTGANGNVHVSRFWHNHQPLYWPEWNSNGSQTSAANTPGIPSCSSPARTTAASARTIIPKTT